MTAAELQLRREEQERAGPEQRICSQKSEDMQSEAELKAAESQLRRGKAEQEMAEPEQMICSQKQN